MTDHLAELRVRLIRVLIILFVGFGLCYGFSEKLFDVLRSPILPYLPEGAKGLHYIGVFEKFMAHIKVSFLGGVFLTAPFWLYQIWGFVAPGLYAKEKKYALGFLTSGVALFLTGAAFAYFVVLPFAFKFLIGFGGDVDKPLITINEYLDFILKFFLGFGIMFEVPVVLSFLGLMGVVDSDFLRQNRRWAILIMAIVSAIITPPDAVSMLALLIPLALLYEVSIWLVKALDPPKAQ
jgi:sec-independent protein translocase protein TatC